MASPHRTMPGSSTGLLLRFTEKCRSRSQEAKSAPKSSTCNRHHVCFLAQQAAEKALKVFLLQRRWWPRSSRGLRRREQRARHRGAELVSE
ncbi:MAG: HEPN domain-containing protein [Chloroflexi bacterium]|nr:MAG: HEPN domain-containing protein [Chloroflexota bacterium]